MATQLIVAHMCKEPFLPSPWAMGLLLLAALNSTFLWLPTTPVSWAVCVVMVLGYLHYVLSVVDQICSYLGIQCLRIKKVRKAVEEKKE